MISYLKFFLATQTQSQSEVIELIKNLNKNFNKTVTNKFIKDKFQTIFHLK